MLQPFALSMFEASRSSRNSTRHCFCSFQISFNSLLEYCQMTKGCFTWLLLKPTSIVSIGAQYSLRLGAEPIEAGRLTWNKYRLGKNRRHGAGSTTGSTLCLSKGQFQLPLICPKFLKAARPSLLNTAKKRLYFTLWQRKRG